MAYQARKQPDSHPAVGSASCSDLPWRVVQTLPRHAPDPRDDFKHADSGKIILTVTSQHTQAPLGAYEAAGTAGRTSA